MGLNKTFLGEMNFFTVILLGYEREQSLKKYELVQITFLQYYFNAQMQVPPAKPIYFKIEPVNDFQCMHNWHDVFWTVFAEVKIRVRVEHFAYS